MNRIVSSIAALALVAACGDPTRPTDGPRLRFVLRSLALDTSSAGTVSLRNSGSEPALNIGIEVGALKAAGGDSVVPGLQPTFLARLDPGASAEVRVTVAWPPGQPPGVYAGWLRAAAAETDSIEVTAHWLGPRRVAILQADTTLRQGDVLQLAAEVTRGGQVVAEAPAWTVVPAATGFVDATGAFVAYGPDSAAVIAAAPDGASDTVRFAVTPRGAAGSLTLDTLGNGAVPERYTSDLWVNPAGTFAYTGTWGFRSAPGNRVYAWDVRNPSAPERTDSVALNAGTINDVKISPDGRLAVATHEGSGDGLNGITLLDLTDPAHPEVIQRYTTGLTSGVHNVWIEPIGDSLYVFACHDAAQLKVINITDPANPFEVAEYSAGFSPVHDVYVRDGLAFVSHWDVGLVILDVGRGLAGGRPGNPVEVSRLSLPEGNVHNAWYWPERALVFVGHELPGSVGARLSSGLVSVVDVADLRAPRRVATFQLAGAGPHNFWVDEPAGVLYSAYYNAGLLAIDVNGRMLGALDRQGRLVAQLKPGGDLTTFVWAPQVVAAGLLWLSDMYSGLWAVSIQGPGP